MHPDHISHPPAFPKAASLPHEIARDLPRYAGEAPQSETTHVDRNVEARARAMRAGSSAELPAPAERAAAFGGLPGAHPARDAVSGFGAAMLVRVRFAGGEIPLWSLVAPLVVLVALTAALGASVVSAARRQGSSGASSAEPPAVQSAPAPALGAASAGAEAPRAAEAETPRADGSAPSPLTVSDLPVVPRTVEDESKLSAAELLAIADERSAANASAARALDAALDRDPGLIKEPKTLAEIRRLVENPETARIVLGSIAGLPGPVSADILYELWTGTVERNETTELARSLLHSRDVRPKASPALAIALELRSTERCEDARALLPRVTRDADRRAFPLVIKLQRRYGCGANKRQDCYPCLRKGEELESAIKAVKERREPRSLTRR